MNMARPPLSVDEAAEGLGLSPQRVRALIASARLPAERIGARYLLDPRDVAAFAQRERRGGRPLGARNAWALLAELSGRAEAVSVSRPSLYRLRGLLDEGGVRLVDALAHAQPRSRLHSWRVLPSDLAQLRHDRRLVPSGLAADHPSIGIRYDPERDGLDAYVGHDDLKALRERLQPEEGSRAANVLLRVPREEAWILDEERAPTSVAAADLLDHRDLRVRRAARAVLSRIASGD